jgi:hypothetical protein
MGHARGLRRGSVTVKIPPGRGRNNARPAVRFLTPAPPARPPSWVAADINETLGSVVGTRTAASAWRGTLF